MVNNDGKYHRDAGGLPRQALRQFCGRLNLRWSHHAQREASVDRYGRAEEFGSGEFELADFFEVTVEGGKIVWAVCRYPYDDNKDLVMVLGRPQNGEAFVKTVWFNLASDKHKTLRKEQYRSLVSGGENIIWTKKSIETWRR